MKDLILEEDFFHEVLFDVKEEQDSTILNPSDVSLVVICDKSAYDVEDYQTLANNIIKALGHTLDQNAAVWTVDQDHIIPMAKIQSLEFKYVLIFGEFRNLVSTQIALPQNTLMSIENQEWVTTFELAQFGSDKKLKMQLWTAIQHWKIQA